MAKTLSYFVVEQSFDNRLMHCSHSVDLEVSRMVVEPVHKPTYKGPL